MANKFINSKWAKVYLANLIDAMPYVKASKSYFADQMKGKKCGKTYSFVLRDSGKVTDGLAIASGQNKDILEKEVKVTLKNKKNVVSLDVLESVVDIESFDTEVGKPYGTHLGAEVQKDAITNTVFDASSAHIEASGSSGWVPLSHAIAGIKSRRVGGKVVGFLDPVAESNLTVSALNNWSFTPSAKGEDFYGDGTIGRFQGGEFVYANDMPTVTGHTQPEGYADLEFDGLEVGTDGKYFLTVDTSYKVTSAGTPGKVGQVIKAGNCFKIDGYKTCNSVGMPTNQDFVFVVQTDTKAGDAKVEVQRVDIEEGGARNCFKTNATDVAGEAKFLLTSGVDYNVAQVRTVDALAFENAPLDDLVGAENTTVEIGGIRLKQTVVGDVSSMENYTRWDIAYGAKIVDNREASLVYLRA